MASRKTRNYRKKKYHSRKVLSKSKKYTKRNHKKLKYRGGGSGNPYAINQYNNPLTYSGNAGWYGQFPRASDQILYNAQTPKMSYNKNLLLANEPIPGVNVAITTPLRQKGGMMLLATQGTTEITPSLLPTYYETSL